MANAWVRDLWVRDATIEVNGSKVRLKAPSSQLRSISRLDEQFRTARYGRGKRWAVEWFDDTTTPVKKRAKRFELKSEAEAFRDELNDDKRSGRYVDPANAEMRFGEASKKWITSKRRAGGSTLRIYETDLRSYVLPRWKNTQLGSITEDHINYWVEQLQNKTAPTNLADGRKSRGLNATSINRLVNIVFGGVLRYAVKRRWIPSNPLANVELPRMEEADKGILRVEELEALAKAAYSAKAPQNATMLRVMGYCGPRIGEVAALRVENFDKESARLHITRTLTVDRDGKPKEGPTKTWEQRALPVPDFLLDPLDALCKEQDPDAYIFRSERGSRLNLSNWRNRVWKKAVDGAGLSDIEGLTPHSLRHTCASIAIAGGIDVKTLQKVLGHKSATETLNTYAHLWPERLDDVANVMATARASASKR